MWGISKGTFELAGERTTKHLQQELQGFEFEARLGEEGKFKMRARAKPFPNNVLEDDQFLKHVASQIKEKNWPRIEPHAKEGSVTAFANGLSVDWEAPRRTTSLVA